MLGGKGLARAHLQDACHQRIQTPTHMPQLLYMYTAKIHLTATPALHSITASTGQGSSGGEPAAATQAPCHITADIDDSITQVPHHITADINATGALLHDGTHRREHTRCGLPATSPHT